LAPAFTWVSWLAYFFDCEDGGAMFLQDFSWLSTNYMALYIAQLIVMPSLCQKLLLHNHKLCQAISHTELKLKPCHLWQQGGLILNTAWLRIHFICC
jgi:hypothetical protein